MKASTAITAAEPEWGKLSGLELSGRRSEFRELLPRLAPAMRSADFSLVRLGLARVGGVEVLDEALHQRRRLH